MIIAVTENKRLMLTQVNINAAKIPILSEWLSGGKDLLPHLKNAIEKLSHEHVSGIALTQLDSPMMKQFKAAKDEVPDALLFFRMGDFYELFGVDAIIASDICGLTLTSRDKSSENPVPMAGSPVVGYRQALKKCIQAGFKVAVCDQIEDPKQAKGIVKREITRIATPAVPGDLLEDEPAKDTQFGCYLASLYTEKGKFTFSYVDVSTGEFRITGQLNKEDLIQEISTIIPKELLAPKNLHDEIKKIIKSLNSNQHTVLNTIESWIIRSEQSCKELFLEYFKEKNISSFGLNQIENSLKCIAAILNYLKSTQKNVLKNIQSITSYELSKHLIVDEATRKNLDFFYTSVGEKKGSLFHFLNQCQTASGSRLLLRRLNYPYKNKLKIEKSHTHIQELIKNEKFSNSLIELLQKTGDIERLLARTAQKSIDPKGMACLRQTLVIIPEIEQKLLESNLTTLKKYGKEHSITLRTNPLKSLLENALLENPASIVGKGDIFNSGYSKELDKITDLTKHFNDKLKEIELQEKEKSQISTLKMGYTSAFGYYFEISKGKISQAPKHFIRKQTLTNCERFITPELKELEEQYLNATEQRSFLERELLEDLRNKILEYSLDLSKASQWIAELDLLLNFSEIAKQHNFCKPVLLDTNTTELIGSKHPILAQHSYSSEGFIENNISLGEDSNSYQSSLIHLITGPNMAGKSTIMRQVAIAHVFCQIGCFVPAQQAQMGIVDKIFSRIGSADNATKNQSTFMVEMLETSNMLNFATQNSLLLLDEVGRGTSTFDGLSIAWAILEFLSQHTKARTLFSTHYHELQSVCLEHKNIKPMQMSVLENTHTDGNGHLKREILFSRKYIEGAAGKSYGLHVAELAGIPDKIINRAQDVLTQLENKPQSICVHSSVEPTNPKEPEQNLLSQTIAAINPDDLTPRHALEILYNLKELNKNNNLSKNIAFKNLLQLLEIQNKPLRKSKSCTISPEHTLF